MRAYLMQEYKCASIGDARRFMSFMDMRGYKYLYDQLDMVVYYWSTKA